MKTTALRRARQWKPRFPLRNFLPEPARGSVSEPARRVPVIAECDVAVFGGGPAGVCAAAAAARCGRRTLLVERHGFLGGMATAANVLVVHTLYGMDRDRPGATPTQVIGGLGEEIIRRLQANKGTYNTRQDGETGEWVICPETTKLVLDDLVIGSGARVLLHAWLAGVRRRDRRIEAAFVETKSGRGAIRADTFIDCTGDADLVRRSGVRTQLGDGHGRCQPPSLCIRLGGRKAPGLGKLAAALARGRMDYDGSRYTCFLWGVPGVADPEERMLSAVRIININAADARDFTRAEIEGRYQTRWIMPRLKKIPGWEEGYLIALPAQIGVRETHRIIADHQLSRREILEGVRFPDAIAQGTYPIDIHCPDGPGIRLERLDGTWLERTGAGEARKGRWDGAPDDAPLRTTLCYQVPYRSLIPQALDNVLAAGRCIGANHDSAGAIRVMINAMQLGEAAGTAAALAKKGRVRSVSARALQRRLVANGFPLIAG